MNKIQNIAPWALALLVIAFDQFTKYLIVNSMQLHQSISVIGEAIRLTYIHNDGLAFGVDAPFGRWLGAFSLVATVIVIVIIYKMKNEPLFIRLLLGSVLGGAIGNTIDRISHGYVIDFIDVDLPDWIMHRWPVFNVADSFVSVSVVLMIIYMIFMQTARSENPDVEEENSNNTSQEDI